MFPARLARPDRRTVLVIERRACDPSLANLLSKAEDGLAKLTTGSPKPLM